MKVYVVTDEQGDPVAVFADRKAAARWLLNRPWFMLWPMKVRRR